MRRLTDRLAGLATGFAVVACYGTAVVVTLLSLLGVSIALNQRVWAGAVTTFAALAAGAIASSYPRHHMIAPIASAGAGLALIFWVMFVSYDRLAELAGFVLLVAATVLDSRARARAGTRA